MKINKYLWLILKNKKKNVNNKIKLFKIIHKIGYKMIKWNQINILKKLITNNNNNNNKIILMIKKT